MLTAWLCASGHDVLLELVDKDHQHYSGASHSHSDHDHHHDSRNNHDGDKDSAPDEGGNPILIGAFSWTSVSLDFGLSIQYQIQVQSGDGYRNSSLGLSCSIDLHSLDPDAPPCDFFRSHAIEVQSLILNSHSVLPNAPPVFA